VKAISREWMTSIVITIILVALVGIGFAVGRYTTVKTFDSQIQGFSGAFTLERILNDKKKSEISRVYHDGDSVSQKLNDISWSVPNTLTPFVGNAPTPGRHGVAHINSMQFRSESEIEIPKPGDTYRIFITGGSTAYGSGAPSEDTTIAGYLSSILTNKLSPSTNLKYEVFTMANPAWASTHERIVIENRLSELTPDLVISFSGNNDVHWGKLGRNILWFRSYADEFFLNLIKEAYKLTGHQEIPEITEISSEEVPPQLVAERLLKNVKLSLFALSLSQKTIDYVYLLQPTLAVTGKKLTEREQESLKYQEYFKKSYAQIDNLLGNMNANNFKYINLTDVFDNLDSQEDIFLDSYHFGDKGNEIIAENIFSQLKDIIVQ